MGNNNFEAARARILFNNLNKIYERVPKVRCQGHCNPFCSAIGLEKIEVLNIEQNRKSFLPATEIKHPDGSTTIRCGELDSENRCSIYDARPMICRLFGATQMMMQCPVGCELEDENERRLSEEEMMGFLLEIKLLNLKYLNIERYNQLMKKLSQENASLSISDYMPSPIYNATKSQWEIDLDTEDLKTRLSIASKLNKSLDEIGIDEVFESKKWRVVKSISQALKDKKHQSDEICIFNQDNNLQMTFQREELINLSEIEIYEKVFNLKDSDIENLRECATCHSRGFKKYLENNSCQFCEGEF